MQVSVLFSGGKDSSLAAILLEPFFDVELVTCSFSLLPVGDIARETAENLGFAHRVVRLDMPVLEKAYAMVIKDGFPKNAINYIHSAAVERLAKDADVNFIADGIRRDDRVPVLDISRIRSIEDRNGVHYMSPLKGYGRAAVNELVDRYLVIEEDQSDNVIKADYETELREMIRQKDGPEKINDVFPAHVQSHVIERKS
ncbi:alpha hydrolase [Methanolobus zinderi]|uniref:Alpha hydrolase n=1 Tax=Methanolobus zinderi TaxID=536044 RepID=A0A7D5E7R1_9EURY|nr:alpha hydrolase [Methanolobus zinderi]QLC49651.1 alpha hydrolase [Methanolobus zinderi]